MPCPGSDECPPALPDASFPLQASVRRRRPESSKGSPSARHVIDGSRPVVVGAARSLAAEQPERFAVAHPHPDRTKLRIDDERVAPAVCPELVAPRLIPAPLHEGNDEEHNSE